MTHSTLKRYSLAVLVVALAAAGAAALWSRTSVADEAAPSAVMATAKPALTVTVARPLLGRLSTQLSANGSIAAWQEASVGSEVQGLRLARLHADIGDTVRTGQVLATFASETVQADLALVRAQLQEAQANALEASGNADRARSLEELRRIEYATDPPVPDAGADRAGARGGRFRRRWMCSNCGSRRPRYWRPTMD